ncbi:MAG: hypothetical protein QOJ84_3489 [Bradyrhizobium sp.]|jgi:hypothetical protein|nr:hypothetical protein [Bradyrhizobium sp.]
MDARTTIDRKRRATLVHINGMERVIPLAGGYLKAYAMADPELERKWDIHLHSTFVDNTAPSKLIADITETAPDVVGFSVYVWNAGLVRRILPVLRQFLPHAYFALGGVEAMDRAANFVDPTWSNVVVCNGEGEKTFRELLHALSNESPSFDTVGGISFYRDGELRTTKPHPRIKSLDEIPSPYLKGYFDRRDFSVALLETNRGCPYACEFCFWGGAVGQKIHRLGSARLAAEIELLGQNKTRAVYMCDANFGIFPEDLDLAKKFVSTRIKTGYPRYVRYSSAKNNPDRAVEVATILARGNVLSVQPISLQTLSARALALAKRESISSDTYYRLQARTNEMGIASFIELIWPMPGETLDSFKKGIQDLCGMGAQAFSVYPLLWLNNVGYIGKEEALGVVTLDCGDANSSAKTVIQTSEVSFEQWVEGLMYTNAVQLLHGCRGLYHTCALVEGLGKAPRQVIFERFQQWMDKSSKTELSRVWRMGRQKVDEIYSTLSWPGHLIDAALVTLRSEFDDTLRRFVQANDDIFGGDHAELISAAVDLDLLARPYVYANTPLGLGVKLEVMKIVEERTRGWLVESPYDIEHEIARLQTASPSDTPRGDTLIAIEHNRGQMYRMPRRIQKEYWDESRMFAIEMGNHYPTWATVSHDANAEPSEAA